MAGPQTTSERTAPDTPPGVVAQRQRRPRIEYGTLLLLLIVGLAIVPAITFVLITAFRTAPPGDPSSAFTLLNWTIVGDSRFLVSFRNTLLVAGLATLFAVPLGFAFGWLQATSRSVGVRLLLTGVLVPLLFSPLLMTVSWIALGSPRAGLLNVFMLRLTADSLSFDIYSFGGMVWVTLLYMVPLAFLTMRGVITNFDASLLEAARVAGASPMRTALAIVFPLLRPGIAAAALLIFTQGVGSFSIVTLLGTTARINTLQRDIYQSMAEYPTDPTFAAVLGALMMTLALINMAIYRRMIRNPKRFQMVGGRGSSALRDSVVARSKAVRRTVVGLAFAYLLLAVIGPYTALAYGAFTPFLLPEIDLSRLSTQNFAAFADKSEMVRGLVNTGLLATLGALATTALAFAIAWRVRRKSDAGTRTLEVIAMASLAIPSISFALGLLWAVLAFPVTRDAFYGTLLLIFVAQMAHFLPVGVQIIGAGIVQMGSDMTEAARVAGAHTRRLVRQILIPLLKPSLASAWLILALYASVEAGMSIFLYTTPSVTTAVNIFTNALRGNQSVMYAGAFILASLGIVLIAIGEASFGATRHLGTRSKDLNR